MGPQEFNLNLFLSASRPRASVISPRVIKGQRLVTTVINQRFLSPQK